MKPPVAGPIKILFLDLDGTLTDGIITYDTRGDARHFWVRDGIALQWAKDEGVRPVVISGRASEAGELRMKDLDLEHYLGAADKVAIAERILKREGVDWDACVMVGDDLPDVPLMRRVGWRFAVANADPRVLSLAHTVTQTAGGAGAVREACELLLYAHGAYTTQMQQYLSARA